MKNRPTVALPSLERHCQPVPDGEEVLGTWTWPGLSSPCPGSDKSACVLNPNLADSDADGLQDGTEIGVVTPTKDADLTKFAPDKDPSTHTDPTSASGLDTDKDGLTDGDELWGRWCYKTDVGCTGTTNTSARQLYAASPLKNGALIADYDG